MKQILFLFISGSLALTSRTQAQIHTSEAPVKPIQVAEWPTLRGNNNRDGRVVSSGEFRNRARLSESIDYATSEGYIELSPSSNNAAITYGKGKVNRADLLPSLLTEWQVGTFAYLDLSGDGKISAVSVKERVKYAQLFKNDKKYYRIEAHDGFDVTSNENTKTVFVGIRVYKGNTDKLVFETTFPKGEDMQRPHVTVADMDNDGEKDIIVTGWQGVYIFNNRGVKIGGLDQNASGWHHLRKRGFACIADIDGNGYKDVIIIGSLPWHVDVIKNNGGVLQFGWTKIFDEHVETANKISRPILNSVNDFDGNGTYEILVNVYNYNDDNNWTGVLFDATNGNVKAQIRDAYVLSAEDVNHDGKYVFFCSETKSQAVPLATGLRALAFENGQIKELLHIDRGEWINPRFTNTSPTVTTHWDGISNLAEDVVYCVDYENQGQKAFFAKTQSLDGSTSIDGYKISKEGVAEKTGLAINVPAGMYGEIIRDRRQADGKRSLLLRVKAFGTPSGTVNILGANAKDLGRTINFGKKNYIPVVADINSDGSEEILIPNDVGEVLCFGKDPAGMLTLQWKVPGRGMSWQYNPALDYGISVDDINHDGYKEVLVSGADEAGAVLFLYDHNGKLLWQKSFPEIYAGDVTLFDGNIAYFGTVQSSKRKNRDVVVTVQRGIAHGGKTYCLDGNDGTVIWELNRLTAKNGPYQIIDSGAGGNVFSTYDIDGDGSEEVMCGYGNIVFFADSNDGTIKFKEFMRKVFTDRYDYPSKGYKTFWMGQILPVAFKEGDEIALSCFNTVVAAGTMNTKGILSWCPKELEYNERYWECMADLDGDGKLWVVELSIRNSDHVPVLLAYDPVSGATRQNFSMEMQGFIPGLGSRIMPASCDMNGDGKDDIIVSNDTGVYCIGYQKGKLSVLWKYLAPGCGPAVIADVDSDGFVEVVVATRSGKILVLDK